MKNSEYVRFKNEVVNADEKHPIWWMGYLWINLTKKQGTDIVGYLNKKSFVKSIEINGKPALEIPSGLAIYTEQEV